MPFPSSTRRAIAVIAATVLGASAAVAAPSPQEPAPVEYVMTVSAPEHHWMTVQATFSDVPAGALELRMSRSSPGRYALHEFAKNVFRVRAVDGAGEALEITRPDSHQWNVDGHDGTVVVTYDIFGDRADGTYLQIDTSHVHANAPATWMWARGELQRRPIRVVLEQPEGERWVVATQLFPTDDPLVFTAPNFQYLMDSPIEFGETELFAFDTPDGQTIRVALHHEDSASDVEAYLDGTRSIVAETTAVFGELPRFDGGTYTFIADYLPWISGDGMEHRNSTIVSSSNSLASAGRGLLGTVAHEFFHAWNVERIRPASLEPFDFERANMSEALWLAEGFTSYYGNLIMHRAGINDRERALGSMAGTINAARLSPGTRFRSAADMSGLAPFVDAARPVDATYWNNTFLSYYTYGSALGLGLDLALRARSDGAVTLDDYMRDLWQTYGRHDADAPPTVPRPYDLAGAEQALARISGDAAFAREFFSRHVVGTETIDYAPLLLRAGFELQPSAPGAFLGATFAEQDGALVISGPTAFGSPAYAAGLDDGDAVTSLAGEPITSNAQLRIRLGAMRPGDVVTIEYRRRDGSTGTTEATLTENPALSIVPLESVGGVVTATQREFREAWLGSQR